MDLSWGWGERETGGAGGWEGLKKTGFGGCMLVGRLGMRRGAYLPLVVFDTLL